MAPSIFYAVFNMTVLLL